MSVGEYPEETARQTRKPFPIWALLIAVAALLFVLVPVFGRTKKPASTPTGKALPLAKVPPGHAQAILAGGCFWSMEAMFKQLKGVDSVEPGYAGGKSVNPSYEQVGTGTTGHAESIRVVYDPKVISFRDLLHVFLSVHNPTTPNQQGYDIGTQYRSVIFFANAAEKKEAQQAIKQISDERVWNGKIVTELTPYSRFYRAEDYHLDYYNLHPFQPYCRRIIAPKIDKFRTKFKDQLKS